MKKEEYEKLLGENLKLMRAYNNLKREVILLRTERDDRERDIKKMKFENQRILSDNENIKQNYNNLKHMQENLSYQNAKLLERFKALENLVLGYDKPNENS